MPRGQRRLNNGPVDVPETAARQRLIAARKAELEAAENGTMNELDASSKAEQEAYRSLGVGIETLQAAAIQPFGPGAHYARKTYAARLFDPNNGTTTTFTMVDVEWNDWTRAVDSAIEGGLIACTSPDAPRPVETRTDVGEYNESSAVRARRNDLRLSFGMYQGKTIREIYRSGQRGEGYVAWLADNARDADVRKAASRILEQEES